MSSNINLKFAITGCLLLLGLLSSCKKMVDIGAPVNSITTEEVFNNDDAAITAIAGIYSRLINTQTDLEFSSGGITILTGLSADEFSYSSTDFQAFYKNALQPNDPYIRTYLWTPVYWAIFKSNACIEGLNGSNSVSSKLKKQLLGEAKFLRAFSFFYLVNLYGDVPLTLTTDWEKNAAMPRTPSADIYNQIISDLKEAKDLMASDYQYSNSERIRANKWAAAALLARVYLYAPTPDYSKAEAEATEVINNVSLFNLASLQNAFLKNGNEAILQLQSSNKFVPYGIPEPRLIIPEYLTKNFSASTISQYPSFFIPTYSLSPQLLNAFEAGDTRKYAWSDTTGDVNGINYYYPAKYKVRQGSPGGTIAEYYTILRLAEQYLIRAEARAQLNKISQAQNDLNAIRVRAGLQNTTANDKSSLLDAIMHERQVEFFAEWGHRWFDLKRLGKADAVLSAVKSTNWQPTDKLYPLPLLELQKAPNLTQNAGY